MGSSLRHSITPPFHYSNSSFHRRLLCLGGKTISKEQSSDSDIKKYPVRTSTLTLALSRTRARVSDS